MRLRRNTIYTRAVLLALLRFGELSLEDWTRAVSIASSILPSFLLSIPPTKKQLSVTHPSIIGTDLLSVILLTSDQCVFLSLLPVFALTPFRK